MPTAHTSCQAQQWRLVTVANLDQETIEAAAAATKIEDRIDVADIHDDKQEDPAQDQS